MTFSSYQCWTKLNPLGLSLAVPELHRLLSSAASTFQFSTYTSTRAGHEPRFFFSSRAEPSSLDQTKSRADEMMHPNNWFLFINGLVGFAYKPGVSRFYEPSLTRAQP